MFFQGIFSTPLPYLVMAFVYMIGWFPGALKNWVGTDENETITTEINAELTAIDAWDELAANELAVYADWCVAKAQKPNEPTDINIVNYWERTHFQILESVAVFKTEYWTSIISRPPPVA